MLRICAMNATVYVPHSVSRPVFLLKGDNHYGNIRLYSSLYYFPCIWFGNTHVTFCFNFEIIERKLLFVKFIFSNSDTDIDHRKVTIHD